jgi:hypothetical protein
LTEEATSRQFAETPFRFSPYSVARSVAKQIITPQTYPREFHIKEAFAPLVNIFNRIRESLYNRSKQLIKKPRLRPPAEHKEEREKLSKLRLPRLAIPKLAAPRLSFRFLGKSKRLTLILALLFLLCIGFFISQFKEGRELEERQNTLQEIQEKVDQAQSLLILEMPQAKEEANGLLKESWEEISQLSENISKLPKDFQNQVFSLKEEISKDLFELNGVETIEDPELFLDFDHRGFVPHRMVIFGDDFYFFSPHSQNLFRMKKNNESQVIDIARTFDFAIPIDEVILFFSKPNQLTILSSGGIFSDIVKEPYEDFSFDDLATFRGNLYFLEKNSGEIIKYSYLGESKWGPPEMWLAQEEKKLIKAESLAIDGFIWILNENNSFGQYYQGTLKEEMRLEIFPEPKDLKKIFTSPTLPYLYLLEPTQNRIIIFDKTKKTVRQFYSQKFDNLLDFTVSEDGKVIYLLNDLKVYQIKP